ncbi:leucine-rich melanocyte differentiation-associated protein-like, partial [Pollicipes pollicipes]|uniref:leucine-rich melanocyte differentiation-associated protein-like n=1 Tax=Pollicipes pollicipes TaxID=41117 RepID=UPI001884C5C1
MEEDYNFMDSTKELHVFDNHEGMIPREVCRLFGPDTLRLNLSSCHLRFSKGLAMFPNVEEIIMDNNELTSLEMCRLPRLHTLSLNNNKVEGLETLLVMLQRCAGRLRYLSILGNPCSPDQLTCDRYTPADYARHRLYVLYMLPQLLFLDSTRVTAPERVEAKRRGAYCRTVKLVKWDAPASPARVEWGEDVLDTA